MSEAGCEFEVPNTDFIRKREPPFGDCQQPARTHNDEWYGRLYLCDEHYNYAPVWCVADCEACAAMIAAGTMEKR